MGVEEEGEQKREREREAEGDTNLPSLAVNYSYISVVVFQPHVHVITERSNQLKWWSLMVIEWVVSNWRWRRRRKREQVTYYIQTYSTASGSISNGELIKIKYHRGRVLFPSIHTMLNSTPLPCTSHMPKFQVELRVL